MIEKHSVAYQLIQSLQQRGVRYIFGVPSGGFLPYLQAINDIDNIEFVLTAHEGGAAFMAATMGKLTATPGVCFATFGPGATNLSTGVGSALLDRSAVIALTDEVADDNIGRTMQMNIDHQALFGPLTKASWRLRAANIADQIERAFAIATQGIAGPVHIGLPVNISKQIVVAENTQNARAKTPANNLLDDVDCNPHDEATISADAIEIHRHLMAAKKPLLAIGLRALDQQSRQAIEQLATILAIPVVVTPMAKGAINEQHSSYAGVLFHALSDRVADIYRQADVVVAIGYDEVEFNYSQWLSAAKLISIDSVSTTIDGLSDTEIAQYQQPIAAVLNRLVARINKQLPEYHWQPQQITDLKRAMSLKFEQYNDHFGPVSALQTLRSILPSDGIMTCDVGAHTHLIGQLWSVNEPMLQLMSNGWSSMGYGIPSAIAAKLACPDKLVCAVLGDGGFLMTANELSVAKRLNLAIVFVLFSDDELALIRIKQDKQQLPNYGIEQGVNLPTTQARLFAVPVLSVDNQQDFADTLRQAFTMNQPVIVEAKLSGDDYSQLVLQANK
ncbi:thiamine pyrophosphate-binding protein [Thalassotalea sp. Y01]|uniref:thiamine pyrophosphate-binding protein n=1 Tax=Thalassotalea sp. Y01 TaxID=2729613 RepID=UPI00145F670F|nr:thiamine pyrophosphate-binding protein [Thalassotalea sp. Y01]NMP17284.1 thiamine pyrophosphate-binding protein [Thalassotalea sp. Y01]